MRTVATVAGALLGGLLTAAPPATAALGGLVVDGSVYHNPAGCVDVDNGAQARPVENHTPALVTVFYGRGCQGEITAVIAPSEIRTVSGTSIQVP